MIWGMGFLTINPTNSREGFERILRASSKHLQKTGPNHMGVSKNRGTPKWMVKIMENPIKMDDLGVPLFLETPISTPEKNKQAANPTSKAIL